MFKIKKIHLFIASILVIGLIASILLVTLVIFSLENTIFEFLIGISIYLYWLYLLMLQPFESIFENFGLVKMGSGGFMSYSIPEISITGLILLALIYLLFFYIVFFVINKIKRNEKNEK